MKGERRDDFQLVGVGDEAEGDKGCGEDDIEPSRPVLGIYDVYADYKVDDGYGGPHAELEAVETRVFLKYFKHEWFVARGNRIESIQTANGAEDA